MTTALLYCRVSTEAQAERYSLEDQLAECRKKAGELGATEVVEIRDDVGGDHLERPMMRQALELCAARAVRWFICWDPDRFSRQLIHQQVAADTIESAGVELIFINHAYSKTAEGVLFFQMRGAIAQYEKAKILERTGRGKRSKARKGEVPGWVRPYGYQLNTATDRLEVVPAEAYWVQQIYTWASDPDPGGRLAIGAVANRLNALGVSAPRGRRWYRSTVRSILHNPLYTGVLTWGRFSHRGIFQARRAGARRRPRPQPVPEEHWQRIPVEPVITPEQWQATVRCLEQGRRRRSPRRLYMLTGMLRCGLCGGAVGRTASGLYRCSRRYPRTNAPGAAGAGMVCCTLPHIKAERVEGYVWRTVRAWLEEPGIAEQAEAEGQAAGRGRRGQLELERITTAIRANEASQERVLALVARSGASGEAAARQLGQLAREHAALGQRRAEVLRQIAVVESREDPAAGTSTPLPVLLDHLTENRRNEAVRRLVSGVVLGGKGEAQWQIIPLG